MAQPEPFQPSLLDWTPPVVAPAASEQSIQLARCEGRLAETILEFLALRLEYGPGFFAADLCSFVHKRLGGSPESALRVLRQLRRTGQAQVELVSRSASSYRVSGVSP